MVGGEMVLKKCIDVACNVYIILTVPLRGLA